MADPKKPLQPDEDTSVDDILASIIKETEEDTSAYEEEDSDEAVYAADGGSEEEAGSDKSDAALDDEDAYEENAESYEDDDDAQMEEHRDRAAAARKRHKKRKRKKSRGISCSLVLLTLIFSVSILASISILAMAMELFGINKDMTEKSVVIPNGATTSDIAELLEEKGIIRVPKLFLLMSRLNGKDGAYIAGEHVLRPSMSYEAMIEELCDVSVNMRETVTVTFREGITLYDAANLLEENEVCDAEDFMFYFNGGGFGYEFESYVPTVTDLRFYRMEGYFFPDTYDFYVDEEPQIVVQKIYENFDRKITQEDFDRMEELGMSLDEVIILASIVQAEAPVASSMKKVAAVFHNRLNNSSIFPTLQSDPTRVYAEDVITPNLPIANKLMLDAYNTYVGQGLPPGAINNPGRDAIEAVLYPADIDHYFFCANVQTGEIFYAMTNAEHEANLALIKEQQAQAGLADSEDSGNG